ncbi:MAG: Oxidoreductase, short-chain dehydrogenase/reductase family [uncultured Caballeronia sp.]|nr:MAG: Oxidoreductase, short-chain dehydrogenase/reductase family [uncultured Caballeronia sp.]
MITPTRVLAQEAGMDGITVNAIYPGIILTEMAQQPGQRRSRQTLAGSRGTQASRHA